MWNSVRVLDPPPVGPVVAEQHGVGVDLLQDLQIAPGLDLEDRAALRAELLDLRAGVGRGQLLGPLPVLEVPAHEGGLDRLGRTSLLDDDRVELGTTVNREDLGAVLDAEQPLPATAFQEQCPEIP